MYFNREEPPSESVNKPLLLLLLLLHKHRQAISDYVIDGTDLACEVGAQDSDYVIWGDNVVRWNCLESS